ncbi:MAG TPA: sulfite reductase subunit alpha [Tepidisphaeraceae bacterium]|nr:sulfite reductase subunit alpha [Tepidisphaeraceae bacterium]
MSTTLLLPESAPFTPQQRAWLSGFFTGLVNVQPEPVAAAPAVEEEFPWHDPALSLSKRLALAAGKPRERQLMAAMAQLDCGACGYLCQTYAEAIASGSEKDLARCTPGGRETNKSLKELLKVLPSDAGQAKSAPAAPVKKQEQAAHGRDNPFPARLVQCKPLNGAGSSKDTRHVVLDLRHSNLSYKVGDALGVYPENCHDTVQQLLEALHTSGAEDVENPAGEHVSLRHALLHDITITRPSDALLELLASSASDAEQKVELTKLAADGLAEDDTRQVIDLLRQFPSARPMAEAFVAALLPLQPRLYSISSSLLAHPNQVHLTVGVVRYMNGAGRTCKGVASNYLTERVRPGQHVRVFVHASPKFCLPSDRNAPVIMVGPGTGIAPFRAFLHERRVDRHPGKNWLFFGDQRSECDFLYRDELQTMHEEGVLTRLDTAFSRDQAEKVYVQTRMMQSAGELWSWLQAGAYFYVCGDAKRMAVDVDRALKQIIAEQGSVDADVFVAAMTRNGRYQRDVY